MNTDRPAVYVDVDNTLIRNGKPYQPVIERIKEMWTTHDIYIWSAGGKRHAQDAVHDCGIEDMIVQCMSKPSYIIDDQVWKWTRYVTVIGDVFRQSKTIK